MSFEEKEKEAGKRNISRLDPFVTSMQGLKASEYTLTTHSNASWNTSRKGNTEVGLVSRLLDVISAVS